MSQGFLSRFDFSANGIRRLLNWYPPFRGAGIRVREIAPDFRSATVELRMKLLNRNFVGTHFGGSLFAMTENGVGYGSLIQRADRRHFALAHKNAYPTPFSVRFLKPARGTVVARFRIPEERVAEARAATQSGEKYEPKFRVEIVDGDGVTVADVEKTLYIRRKKT